MSLKHKNTSFLNFESGDLSDITEDPIQDYGFSSPVAVYTFGESSLGKSILFNGSIVQPILSPKLTDKIIDSESLVVSLIFKTPEGNVPTTATECYFALNKVGIQNTYMSLMTTTSGNLSWRFKEGGAGQLSVWRVEVPLQANTEYHVVAWVGPNGNNMVVNGSTANNTWENGSSSNTEGPSSFSDRSAPYSVTIGAAGAGSSSTFRWPYGADSGYNGVAPLKDFFIDTKEIDVNTAVSMYNGVYGYDTIALAGQSNMRGNPDIRVGIDDNYSTVSNNVYQFGYSDQSISDATNPLKHISFFTNRMGCWLSLCNSLVPKTEYKRKTLLVPLAKGGTGFTPTDTNDNWGPNEALLNGAISSLNAALNTNYYNNLICFAWWQGEKDAIDNTTTYGSDFSEMIDSWILNVPKMNSSTPVLMLQPGSWEDPGQANVEAGLLSYQDSSFSGRSGSNIAKYISLSDQTRSDDVHYTAESVSVAGERLYSTLSPLIGIESSGSGGSSAIPRANIVITSTNSLSISSSFILQPSQSVRYFTFPELGWGEIVTTEVLREGGYSDNGVLIAQGNDSGVLCNESTSAKTYRITKSYTQSATRVESN